MTDKKKNTEAESLDAASIVEQTTVADIFRAAYYLDNVAVKTKLIESPYFSSISGNTVLLKPENLQVTGSFKLRGAYNRISQLPDDERAKGVITAS
ncbi:MAG: pyridoxal-phosphate dependent enzyme, partial [Selenomonadaceae bacterium]|nr:pyridoxal-phosphate dependent enzyme [Selenomonadaceae bacterium]